MRLPALCLENGSMLEAARGSALKECTNDRRLLRFGGDRAEVVRAGLAHLDGSEAGVLTAWERGFGERRTSREPALLAGG